MRKLQITSWCQNMIRMQVPTGGFYIDATMGKGNDTLLLCQLAGEEGKVLAFDVQEKALDATKKRLEEHGVLERAKLVLDGHEHMDQYAENNSADVICFNFGYLPGGDHTVATSASTSIEAVKKGMQILKKGAMMSLCIYSGGDTGFEEKEALLAYLKKLPAKEYTVIVNEYYNKENNPPLPVFVFKL